VIKLARFVELNDYINEVLLKVINSQNLCKYINYNTDEETDPLTSPDLDIVKRSELLFKRIFPFPKLPSDTELLAGTYLTVYFDNIDKGGSVYWKNSVLVFNVISHLDQWRMPAKLRPYAIMNEIDVMFNNQKVVGIGKAQFDKSRFMWVNKDFAGYSIQYKFVDFS
jgi:hypothetical protein